MTPDEEKRYAYRVLSVTSLGVLLAAANTSTLDVALPVVSRHFNASPTEASWLLLSYMLVNTVLILVFGRLADIIGRRRLYISGLATLTVSSLACGFAPTILALDGMRAIQAVGAAAIITNTSALLTDAFPAPLLATGLGLNVSVAAGAQVIGPLLGGSLAQAFGWRAVFLFNVPTGLVGLLWARRSLRKPTTRPVAEPFDAWGALLSLVMLGSLVIAISEAGELGWSSPVVAVSVVALLVSTPAFILVQLRRRYPLVDLSLFADRERSMAYIASFLLSLARFAVVLLAALYVQAARGEDAAAAGVQVTPVAVGMMLASPVAGRLASRFGARILSTTGLLVTGLGLVALAVTLSPTRPYPVIGVALLAVGVGSGLFMTPNTTSIMSSVPASRRGIANGVRSMLQNTGYVVSTALSLAIVTAPLSSGDKRLAYAGRLTTLSPHSLGAFTGGYHHAFLVLAVMTALGMVASLLRNPPKAGATPEVSEMVSTAP